MRYKYRSPNIDVYKDTLSKEGFQIKLTSDWWRAPSGGHSFENFDKLWERLKESENIKIKNVKKWFSQGRILRFHFLIYFCVGSKSKIHQSAHGNSSTSIFE